MVRRGDVVWADFGRPRGSSPAFRRPAVVIQADWLNDSAINTILVVPLTTGDAAKAIPMNVHIPLPGTGLDRECVAQVAQVGPLDRGYLDPHPSGVVPSIVMRRIEAGIRLVAAL